MNTSEVFAKLPGSWALTRIIPGRGKLTGQVTFTEAGPHRLLCEERGLLELDQIVQTFEATRSYIYELRGENLFIFYNDGDRKGDVLHELVFNQGNISTHCHVCARDTYDLTMTMAGPDKIEMIYKVSGPQKSYTMESTLTREASHPS